MKIASFNANGIRARLPVIQEWLFKEKTDVLCLQETKVSDHDFPRQPLEDLGYFLYFRGEKGYNGVALLSRIPLAGVVFGFMDGDTKEESRVVTARLGDIVIVNTYVPHGSAPYSEKFRYKLDWLYRLYDYFRRNFTPTTPLIWVGDFNVAPEAKDVYNPEQLWGSVGFHQDEHKALARFKEWGLVDIFRKHHPEGSFFTFWDYR
ncbi:MAG: exodeoxyribonuclease III, partial [Desulfobacterota bacterium]|nr:exodeoxyribonuclease III [Thermodesulfobacteriota bacterium]